MIITSRKKVLVLVIVVCVLYFIDRMYEVPIMEDTGDTNPDSAPLGRKLGVKKSYKDFVAIAKVDHKRPINIPWIRLPNLDGFLPTYLKYKEHLLVPVVDQGKCASCWSISVAHMIAGRISIYTGGKIMRPLSIQEMISCWDGHQGKGCSVGGIPETAYNYIIKNGLGLDKDYPYEQERSQSISPCSSIKMTGPRTYLQRGSVRSLCRDPYIYEEGSQKYRDVIAQNVKNMKTELFVNGPFVGTIMVYQNLYNHDGLSVYKGHNGSKFVGGHACLIYSYAEENVNSDEPGFSSAYWGVVNSWSVDWPTKSPASKGLFYIKAGENVCGIESRASRALPVLTDEVRANSVKSLDESRFTSYNDYANDPNRENFLTKVGRVRSMLKR